MTRNQSTLLTLLRVAAAPQTCLSPTLSAIALFRCSRPHGLTADTQSRGWSLRLESSTKLHVHQPAVVTVGTTHNPTSMASSPDSLPKVQRAILANDKLTYEIRDDAPMPELAAGRVLIKTVAVGLNPVDTKMIGPFVTAGASYGVRCLRHLARTCALVNINNRPTAPASWSPSRQKWQPRDAFNAVIVLPV